jgi:hypothetical protein
MKLEEFGQAELDYLPVLLWGKLLNSSTASQ